MRVFTMQRVSAVALIIFMTIHMVVVHYPPFHIDFSRIAVRMAEPLWQAIDIAFLFFVLMHALAGAYVVLTDVERFGSAKAVPGRRGDRDRRPGLFLRRADNFGFRPLLRSIALSAVSYQLSAMVTN